MDTPTTLAGWFGLMLTVLTLFTLILGVVIRMARQHINAAINKTLSDRLEVAVLNGNAPMAARLDAINTQLVTQDGELGRVLSRVGDVETTINNGLCARQERIEGKMDRLIEHLMWDGRERRIDET